MKKIVMAFLFACVIWGCESTTGNSDQRSISGNKYVNGAIGLSLQFPANWQLKLDQKYGSTDVDLAALGPAVQNFSPNVTVIISPHSGTTNWNEVLDTVKAYLQAQIPDLGQYQGQIKELNGKQYAEITYTTTSYGNLMKIRQELLMHGTLDITLTFTDFASRFDQNSDFQTIANSLSF